MVQPITIGLIVSFLLNSAIISITAYLFRNISSSLKCKANRLLFSVPILFIIGSTLRLGSLLYLIIMVETDYQVVRPLAGIIEEVSAFSYLAGTLLNIIIWSNFLISSYYMTKRYGLSTYLKFYKYYELSAACTIIGLIVIPAVYFLWADDCGTTHDVLFLYFCVLELIFGIVIVFVGVALILRLRTSYQLFYQKIGCHLKAIIALLFCTFLCRAIVNILLHTHHEYQFWYYQESTEHPVRRCFLIIGISFYIDVLTLLP